MMRSHVLMPMALLVTMMMASTAVAQNQPSLDEMLDLPSAPKPAAPAPATPKPAGDAPRQVVPVDPQVQRRLDAQNANENFEQAIAQMDNVANRLGKQKDPGLDTQRLQEEILARLDQVIAAAKMQQSSSSSSSSSSDSSGDSSNNPSQPSGGEQGNQQNQVNSGSNTNNANAQSQANAQKSNGRTSDPNNTGAGARQGSENSVLEESRQEWGSLPPRVRQQLLEGLQEKRSPVYKDLTEAYYKRLAEENR